MEALKFSTTVLENGIIKIPELKNYTDHQVEVFIVIRPEKKNDSGDRTIEDFLSDWSGYFKVIESNDVRYNYLINKYK